MVAAKVSTPLILTQIQSSKTHFNLSTSEVIRLTKAGVPDVVIQAMRNPTAAAEAEAKPAQSILIPDGTPVRIALLEDVPANAQPGLELRFRVSQSVLIRGVAAIAKGALVTGAILARSRKKFIIKTEKPTYRLLQVSAADGSKLKVRATPGAEVNQSGRQLDPQPAPPKNLAAQAGDEFLAYIEGDQTVTLRH